MFATEHRSKNVFKWLHSQRVGKQFKTWAGQRYYIFCWERMGPSNYLQKVFYWWYWWPLLWMFHNCICFLAMTRQRYRYYASYINLSKSVIEYLLLLLCLDNYNNMLPAIPAYYFFICSEQNPSFQWQIYQELQIKFLNLFDMIASRNLFSDKVKNNYTVSNFLVWQKLRGDPLLSIASSSSLCRLKRNMILYMTWYEL